MKDFVIVVGMLLFLTGLAYAQEHLRQALPGSLQWAEISAAQRNDDIARTLREHGFASGFAPGFLIPGCEQRYSEGSIRIDCPLEAAGAIVKYSDAQKTVRFEFPISTR